MAMSLRHMDGVSVEKICTPTAEGSGFNPGSRPTPIEMFSGASSAPMTPPRLPGVSSPSEVQLNGSLENSTTQCFAVMTRFGATSVAVHREVCDPFAITNTTASSDSPEGSPPHTGSVVRAEVSETLLLEQAVLANAARHRTVPAFFKEPVAERTRYVKG